MTMKNIMTILKIKNIHLIEIQIVLLLIAICCIIWDIALWMQERWDISYNMERIADQLEIDLN